MCIEFKIKTKLNKSAVQLLKENTLIIMIINFSDYKTVYDILTLITWLYKFN